MSALWAVGVASRVDSRGCRHTAITRSCRVVTGDVRSRLGESTTARRRRRRLAPLPNPRSVVLAPRRVLPRGTRALQAWLVSAHRWPASSPTSTNILRASPARCRGATSPATVLAANRLPTAELPAQLPSPAPATTPRLGASPSAVGRAKSPSIGSLATSPTFVATCAFSTRFADTGSCSSGSTSSPSVNASGSAIDSATDEGEVAFSSVEAAASNCALTEAKWGFYARCRSSSL